MKKSIMPAIINSLILALTLLHSSCGPSREERIRMVFEKHKGEIAKCEKLLSQGLDSRLSSGAATMESLQKGDLSGALRSLQQQQQETTFDRGRKCHFELRNRIDEELKAQGLPYSPAPEIEKVWQEYRKTGMEAK